MTPDQRRKVKFGPWDEKRQKSELSGRKLSFLLFFAAHPLIDMQDIASPFPRLNPPRVLVDEFAFQRPICIVMKKNVFPPNSYNSFVLRCRIHINTIHMLREDKYVDTELVTNYALIYLSNGVISINSDWRRSAHACGSCMNTADALTFLSHVILIRAAPMKTYWNHIDGCNCQITGGCNERRLENKVR